MGDMSFSFSRTENQSAGIIQVSLQEGSELSLDLNICLDPVFTPFAATWENEFDEPEFIFWSNGDQRNWQGMRGGNWSFQLEGQDSATLGSSDDIALLRVGCKISPEVKVWKPTWGLTDWDEKPK